MQTARSDFAAHVSTETTHNFDVALHGALITSITSMTELRDAVRQCVASLKAGDIGPVQMLLAMKACALDSAERYHPAHDEYPTSNIDLLMDYIVRWSIAEYYDNVS